MIVGLEWDGTVTHDINAWLEVVKIFKTAGHKVYIVTMRYASEGLDMDPRILSYVDQVIFTDRQGKRSFLQQLQLHIDVWIEDNPEAIFLPAEHVWSYKTSEGVVYDPANPAMPKLVRINVKKCVEHMLLTHSNPQSFYDPV